MILSSWIPSFTILVGISVNKDLMRRKWKELLAGTMYISCKEKKV